MAKCFYSRGRQREVGLAVVVVVVEGGGGSSSWAANKPSYLELMG